MGQNTRHDDPHEFLGGAVFDGAVSAVSSATAEAWSIPTLSTLGSLTLTLTAGDAAHTYHMGLLALLRNLKDRGII